MATLKQEDLDLAWVLYIDLVTRVTTYPLDENCEEKEALDSVYKFFTNTRQSIIDHTGSVETSGLVIPILNKNVRPFLAKWNHRPLRVIFGIGDEKERANVAENKKQFRKELESLQGVLFDLAKELSKIAYVPTKSVIDKF